MLLRRTDIVDSLGVAQMKRVLWVFVAVCVLSSGRISNSRAAAMSPPRGSIDRTTAFRPAAPKSDPLSIVAILALAVGIGSAQVALVAGAIAYQFPRSLSHNPSDEWEDADYFRSLPNALAMLAEHGFQTAWPRRCNPWSMNRFQRRLERILEPLLGKNVERFVQQHLSAWRWTISHRSAVALMLRAREREQAFRLLAIAVPEERITLLAALNSPQSCQLSLKGESTKRRLQRVERLQAILREHGYSLCLQVDSANEQFQDLPNALPALPTRKTSLH